MAPDIGWIDLVWGFTGTRRSDGYGLSKVVKYHPSVVPQLAEIIKSMAVTGRTDNRYKLESDRYFTAVSGVWFEGKKTWLLTLFEKLK